MTEGEKYELRPVGVVRSPFRTRAEAPHQGRETDLASEIVVFSEYADALLGVEAGSRIVVLAWLHQAARDILRVHPRGNPENPLRGVFATRSPVRPNPIALNTVEVLEVDGTTLRVRGLDLLDGTPLLDLKIALGGV